MAKLGDPVTYEVPPNQHTVTVKDGVRFEGSTYHAELIEFAGVIARVHSKDGTGSLDAALNDKQFDLAIFVPGSPKVAWVVGVHEGKKAGEFKVVG
jgi:hypothetical protein